MKRVLLQLRIEAHNMTFLAVDEGGIFLRNMWLNEKGDLKSRTIPLTEGELRMLAEYVVRHQAFEIEVNEREGSDNA
jgi:hypothetical protein